MRTIDARVMSKAVTLRFLGMSLLLAPGCSGPPQTEERPIVVYTSVDQQLAEPIIETFTRETGLALRPLYDTEATKTTGLVNRLIAEKQAPRADVFWNSEVIRTVVLKRKGVLEPYRSPVAHDIPDSYRDQGDHWTGHALRARVIAYDPSNTAPQSVSGNLEDLVAAPWMGQVAMGYPMFGTTGSHVAALFAVWGPDRTESWLRGLVQNSIHVVDGNSTARDRVADGVVRLALTDTDDVAVARARGDVMGMKFAEAGNVGTFVIPATVALVKGGPNPDGGRILIDYLLSPEVEAALVRGEGAFMPVRDASPWPQALPPRDELRAMRVNYEAVADQLEQAMVVCRDLFVRR